MANHTEVGGPTAADRQFVYARAGLSTESAKHVERMIEGSGTRCVGKSALTNVRVRMQSHKNQAPRVVESHTCELVYASGPSDTTPLPKATFYAAIDGCRMPMAHALIFGPARTDGLALLMREHVKRNGFLPRTIHLDRGSENTSVWTTEFCEGRINLRHSPTAASAWNGIAESAIKQINAQVAHELPGNTLPDQYGRSVDGRFKSVNQAKMAFTTVHDLFIKYMYEDLPSTPGDDGRTPLEMREEARAAFGVMGTECQWNDDFLIQTSVRPRRWSCDARRGIRISTSWFLSDPLIELLRTSKPTDVRTDCCDPSICWVMIAGVWVKACVATGCVACGEARWCAELRRPRCKERDIGTGAAELGEVPRAIHVGHGFQPAHEYGGNQYRDQQPDCSRVQYRASTRRQCQIVPTNNETQASALAQRPPLWSRPSSRKLCRKAHWPPCSAYRRCAQAESPACANAQISTRKAIDASANETLTEGRAFDSGEELPGNTSDDI